MDTERSNLGRATALALVGLAVMGGASRVEAQEKPASAPQPPPPSWPSAYPAPQQGTTASPPPVWPDQQRRAGEPQQGTHEPTPPAEPPVGYVRLPPPNVHDGFYLRLHV